MGRVIDKSDGQFGGAWVPAGRELSEESRVRAALLGEGPIVIESMGSRLWGAVVAVGLLAIAAVTLNPSILVDVDPMSPAEVLLYALGTAAASLGVARLLVVPSATISEAGVEIVNPLRTYRGPATEVEVLETNFLNFGRVRLGSRAISVVALEHTLTNGAAEGFERVLELARQISAAEHAPAAANVVVRITRLRWFEVVLALGWSLYALSFAAYPLIS